VKSLILSKSCFFINYILALFHNKGEYMTKLILKDGFLCLVNGYLAGQEPPFTDEGYFTFLDDTQRITGYSDSGPKDVKVPPTIRDLAVLQIGSGVFREKGLTSVLLPNTMQQLYSDCFRGNPITSVNLPSSLAMIGSVF